MLTRTRRKLSAVPSPSCRKLYMVLAAARTGTITSSTLPQAPQPILEPVNSTSERTNGLNTGLSRRNCSAIVRRTSNQLDSYPRLAGWNFDKSRTELAFFFCVVCITTTVFGVLVTLPNRLRSCDHAANAGPAPGTYTLRTGWSNGSVVYLVDMEENNTFSASKAIFRMCFYTYLESHNYTLLDMYSAYYTKTHWYI